MNVYQLKPKGKFDNAGGMALVAAHSFEMAKHVYELDGSHAEEYVLGEFTWTESSKVAIIGLDWQGGVSVICDSIVID